MSDEKKSIALPARGGSPNDFQTPPVALDSLIPYLNKEWIIWECAAGQGSLADRLLDEGFGVESSDILTRQDFMAYEPEKWDCVVTNPPYAIKDDFIKRAYQLKKPWAFLLPPRALEGLERQALYKKHGLGVIMLNRRVKFTPPSGEGSGAWFPVAWFTHGLGLDGKLVFGTIPKHQPFGRGAEITDLPLFN